IGWTFYSLENLPELGDSVWCKWPQRGLAPGETSRPVLVRGTTIREHPKMGQRFGGVAVTFGTGTLDLERNRDRDLILGPREFRAAGLHKPTRFSLNGSPRGAVRFADCGDKLGPSQPREARMAALEI